MLKIFHKGFNYSQDGQGNRLVLHLQGCNMRCQWCTNPEGLELNGTCQSLTVDEVLEEILSASMLFFDGGGVTFTGGECTLQFDELKQILRELQEHHINTAIETNATHPRLPELFGSIDQLIMDCKQIDNDKHIEWTGTSNATILRNIKSAAENHPFVHIRVPLVGGVNNSKEDRENFIEFFRSIGGDNVSFEVLRYHEFGKKKWKECGLDYKMTDEANVTPEEISLFRSEIESAGLNYRRT